MTDPQAYLVRGCGICILCYSPESMKVWVNEIIERGGIPEVTKYEEPVNGLRIAGAL